MERLGLSQPIFETPEARLKREVGEHGMNRRQVPDMSRYGEAEKCVWCDKSPIAYVWRQWIGQEMIVFRYPVCEDHNRFFDKLFAGDFEE